MAKKIVTIYSKICLPCFYDNWYLVEDWAKRNDVALVVRRTSYNPLWHKLATKIWGDEYYPSFAVFFTRRGTYLTMGVDEMIKKIKEGKEYDVQALLGAAKRVRKNRKVVEAEKDQKAFEGGDKSESDGGKEQ